MNLRLHVGAQENVDVFLQNAAGLHEIIHQYLLHIHLFSFFILI